MKKIITLLACFAVSLPAFAQNCGNTSVGFPPINDLGTGTWRGVQGGLYPNGSNQRPAVHNADGLTLAQQIVPLNAGGSADTSGSIVWLSVGMSNTTQESQVFIPMADTFGMKNPKLTLVDGAQGGQDIDVIINPSDPYWTVVNNRLQAAGLTPAQVQAVWFKQAEKNPTDTAFASYPDALKAKYKTAMQILKEKFPNLKLCYLSSRIYAGYANTMLNPEPYAYYNGWTVKRLIEDQINGDTALAYSGPNPRAPWLAWGPYPWADGTTPRSDGLTWICPDDYISDGTHPSMRGRQKMANMLLDFFSSDATAIPWFMKQSAVAVPGFSQTEPAVLLYPQPAQEQISVSFSTTASLPKSLIIYGVTGRKLKEIPTLGGKTTTVDLSGWPAGMYWLRAGAIRRAFVKE
jgi:hypothetical protein